MSRLARFEGYRHVGVRDSMLCYDCDDPDQFETLKGRVDDEGLVEAKLLQSFAPDTMEEARNRGFEPAVKVRS